MPDETTPAANADDLGWKFPLHVPDQPGPYALDTNNEYALHLVHAANSKPSGGPEYEAMRARLHWVVDTLNAAEAGRERTVEAMLKALYDALRADQQAPAGEPESGVSVGMLDLRRSAIFLAVEANWKKWVR